MACGCDLEEVRDCGDRVLATCARRAAAGRAGDRLGAQLRSSITFRDGKILRYQEFYDEAAALEAAGAGGLAEDFGVRAQRRGHALRDGLAGQADLLAQQRRLAVGDVAVG